MRRIANEDAIKEQKAKLIEVMALRALAGSLILAATGLLLLNVVGFFRYTTIDVDNPNLLEAVPAKRSTEQEFWEAAYRGSNEELSEYVTRLNRLVSDRMLAVDPRHAKPTVFENYILWAVASRRGHYEWATTGRAVRLGGGFCSQHAIVLNNLLRAQGIDSRILWLNGHVLNEVLIADRWTVFDPLYGVSFTKSLRELEREPAIVYQTYRNAGLPDAAAKRWQEVFASDVDNWHFRTSEEYIGGLPLLQEGLSFYLIWLIPAGLLVAGAAILAMGRRGRN